MEEILVVVIQLFFELFLQGLLSGLLDLAGASFGKKWDEGCFILVMHIILGGGMGWLSTLLVPQLLLPNMGLRIAYVLVSPLIAGAISALIIKQFSKGQSPRTAFVHGAAFALMFALARYAAGVR